jgi:hypothetical protein
VTDEPPRILGRPVELSANESFTVTLKLPPPTCHRCAILLPDRVGYLLLPSMGTIESRTPSPILRVVAYFFCDPCAKDVAESTRAGVTCHHGIRLGSLGNTCRGCDSQVAPEPKP